MIEQFKQMPKGMQVLMAVLSGAALLGMAAMIDPRAIVIVALGLMLVVAAVAAWKFYQKWKAHQRSQALTSQLSENSSSAPSSISDPARRAKLDDLRQNFGKGVEKFRSAGKDLYSLPWYVVCGEPGSGKTEAIRHCNVGFPPGLQDEMQGAGGTLNMHWWFTNQAVLLDTAGKLLFQEALPGTTNEWTEFLNLLRKTRPDCPINGLLLVIPVESLIRDSFEDIQRKAGKIAQQLDVIQKRLDVRFPVFVLITKCDLINGFREFFAGLKDPQLQHQMTGWSNGESLDAPFRPDAVDQHLDQVVQRIRRRRLGLLKDPIPSEPGARRVDEVDALFTLPGSIAALGPRLRRYLETIFVASEWSARPLFLRGIYFTSALTEGSALDAELASALGLAPESLPDGKAWERERSFFLRDLFTQKIFKEQGLVTRATNTGKLVRQRQWIIASVVGCGLLFLVVLSIIGRNALKSSVGEELALWRAGANPTEWAGNRWHPVVDNGLVFVGNDPVRIEGNREWPVIEFHEKLQQRVSTDLHIPWIFKPIETVAVRANPGRRRAQRVLFEASVVGPLVEASRERFLNDAAWVPADIERLATLVELEGSVHLKKLPGYVADFPGEDFITPLLAPSIATLPERDAYLDRFIRIFDWTYFGGGEGRGKWPGDWLGRGKTLRDNPPLARAFDGLEKDLQSAQAAQRDAFQVVQDGRLTVIRFLDSEKAFLAAAGAPRTGAGWQANVETAWSDLATRRAAVDTLIGDLKRKTGVTGEITLEGGYRAAVERIRGGAGRASQRIRASLQKQKLAADAAAQAATGPASEFTLYRDVQRRLTTLDTRVNALLEQALPPSEQAQLADLDQQALRATAAGASAAYLQRSAVYADAMQRLGLKVEAGASLLGRLGSVVGTQTAAISAARDSVAKYEGPLRVEFATGVRNLLDGATTISVQGLMGFYTAELEAISAASAGFPFGRGPALDADEFKAAVKALDKVKSDAADPAVPAEVRRGLESQFERAARCAAFAASLTGADGEPLQAKLVLIRDRDQATTIERVAGAAGGTRVPLARVYPSFRLAGRDLRARGLVDNLEIGRFGVTSTPPQLEFSTTPDPKPVPDATIVFESGWSLLRLILQSSIRRADGLEWDTVVRLREDKTELALGVTVVFEKPLPTLDRWPVSAK